MKRILSYIPLAGMIMLHACSDDMSEIGGSTKPDLDQMNLLIDSAYVKVDTVMIDGIYAKTTNPLLGAFHDETFGYIQSDFLTEFYCADNFKLHDDWYKEVNPKIDSAFVRLYYSSFVGDAKTPHEATVYRLQRNLDRHYYSNVDPRDYVQPDGAEPIVLGKTSYTGIDYSVSDSIRALEGYTPSLRIRMKDSFLEEFKNQLINSPATFNDSKSFKNWFKGIYVENSRGKGTLLKIVGVEMVFYFDYHGKASNGADSLIHAGRAMPMTREVIQLNNYYADNVFDPMAGPEYSYIKAPGGIFATMKMPLRSVISKHRNEIVNRINYSFKVSKLKNSLVPHPKHLLLISKEEYDKKFFENGNLPSIATSSFMATYDSINFVYSFSNIGGLLSNQMKKYANTPEEQIPDSIVSYLIPITVSTSMDNRGNVTIDKISHSFSPVAVRIKNNKFPQPPHPDILFGHKLDMIFSKYAE